MGISNALQRANRVTNNRGVKYGKHVLEKQSLVRKTLKTIKAVSASWMSGLIILPMWNIHLVLWVVSLAGIGVETLPVLGYVLPGQTIFQAFSLLGVVWGLLMMLVPAAIYSFRFVNWWSNTASMITFGLCLAFSVCPGIFGLLPWVLFWCAVVVTTQTQDPQEDGLQTGGENEGE